MELHYVLKNGLPSQPELASLLNLLATVFTNQSQADLLTELNYQQARTGIQILLALENEQIVGCKLGYERKPGHYYSWLGCVDPSYRGRGIAKELMNRQHDWCREQNYSTVRTQTYNQWREMLILNLRCGFDIIGTVQGRHGLTIVLEKII
ncbi:GNAT family N-acetyltransferase [Spirosoma aureum]|uniref:GNAT family N-acetyltransferase n=1 Tax=Spirosoma aureum TaxID=2692134 RepID=A0A6G9AWL4_9BACT|nr:GNAT family N-acetyltransferase [Spirosoma aureum]QIP16862.1 GNAT family N-acetyltransferase [Spirosoma aureum]